MKIPKILHQTWKTSSIPKHWERFQSEWIDFHPDWEYRLWTDEDNRRFIEKEYPDFLELYDSYPYNIQRADAIRYFILHKLGGVYVDLDYQCIQNIEKLLNDKTCVVGLEPNAHSLEQGLDKMLCNAFMAVTPDHSFMCSIIELMKKRIRDSYPPDGGRGILWSTGPILLTDAFKFTCAADLELLPSSVLSPFCSGDSELAELSSCSKRSVELREILIKDGCFAVHHWHNSWSKPSEELKNSMPNEISGYIFIPGKDSPGFDLKDGGRDVASLAQQCSLMDRAVGFNTDGYIKSKISALKFLSRMSNPNGNEGLYIKRNLMDQYLSGESLESIKV
ncbi:glycosyltransferase family 32 protein [Microbulbifer epialgicus]|uniref:Glycosyltransferase family 32 protein n=1 Tax=Microbulbifer epialgicus TaxID=393907 RepID=A0ABV4P3Y6_9GAMM